MIKQWLEEYQPKTQDDAEQALREIMQEITLAGLQRSGFFEKAAFYGGTALRVFYGLDRFSEDLDFSLLEKKTDFSLEPYFAAIHTEFNALGINISIKEKMKTNSSTIDSAFLKSATVWNELELEGIIPQEGIGLRPSIKIKLEVDTAPPLGFETEEKLLVKPFSFYVKCFKQPDLFAGKMHALLFRKWKTRVKGRDWYDLEWYIQNGVPIHLDHFLARAIESGDWLKKSISNDEFKLLIHDKIDSVSFDYIKSDIIRFIPDNKKLEIWSANYFMDLIEKIKYI